MNDMYDDFVNKYVFEERLFEDNDLYALFVTSNDVAMSDIALGVEDSYD